MSEKRMTKIAGEVPMAEAGAWSDLEQGIYSIIDGSCYLAEIWTSQTPEMQELDSDLDFLIERLHKGETLDFSEIERLSDHVTVKQAKNARVSFLVGFQQGMKLSNLLSSDNLAKTALELKII